jgi:hypothetical protein
MLNLGYGRMDREEYKYSKMKGWIMHLSSSLLITREGIKINPFKLKGSVANKEG